MDLIGQALRLIVGDDRSARARSVATAMRCLAGAGLGEGSVLLYQGRQAAELIPTFWASIALGGIFVPIDAGWPDYLVGHAAGRLRPTVIIAGEEQLPALARQFPEAAVVALSDLNSATSGMATESASIGGEAPATYLFTSGSTGTPKAVVLSRDALAHGARTTLASFGWRAGDRLVNLPEPHTMSGLRNALVAAPLGGLDWRPVPASALDNIFALTSWLAEVGCDHLVVGPIFLRQLMLMGTRLPKNALGGVRAVYSTGAALRPAAATWLRETHGIPVINYYGLTETGGICLSQSLAEADSGDSSLGHPVGCEARLVDEGVAGGDDGELQIRSPQMMTGYLDDPEATAERFDGGWLRTGDVMHRDACGRFHLVGRSELAIKSASTDRLHPEELENLLEHHEAVIDAAAIGFPSAAGIDQIALLVVRRSTELGDNALKRALGQFIERHLGRSRRPNLIIFVDKLPRTDTGKIVRTALREMLP